MFRDVASYFASRSARPGPGAQAVRLTTGLACLALLGGLAACDDMDRQPRGKPQASAAFFNNSSLSRPLVEGTVPRGQADADMPYFTGVDENGAPLQNIPEPVTAQLLARGRERFNIYCIECHGQAGDGRGMVVLRGFPAPPSYHEDRLRHAPAGHFFDVITHGMGKMPPYNIQVDPADRWAIIAYIRALELSQHATIQDVPPAQRSDLEAAP